MASDPTKIDPMHQFEVQTIAPMFDIGGVPISFTNSAFWMVVTLAVLWLFMLGGMKRQVVPGRWQMMVEGFTGFVDKLLKENIGKGSRKYLPYVFSLFMFILFANLIGLLPLGLFAPVSKYVPELGVVTHPFTFTSHFTITGVLAIMSFSIVLIVGFAKHGLKFFSLFVPAGTPLVMKIIIAPIEFISFLFRPFSLGLRLFVAMIAGHILLKVLAGFVIQSSNASLLWGGVVGIPSFVLMVGVSALEVLVAGIQAYVFALLTSLYIHDAEHLH